MSRISQTFTLLVCGIASTLLTWQITAGCDSDYYGRQISEICKKELFPVVYCRKDIPANTVITPDHLELRIVPDEILPANACDCILVALGRKVNYPIKKGDALFLADFRLLNLPFPDSVPTVAIPLN